MEQDLQHQTQKDPLRSTITDLETIILVQNLIKNPTATEQPDDEQTNKQKNGGTRTDFKVETAEAFTYLLTVIV